MINNCKFFNIALGVCGHLNSRCPYITDSHSCPDYEVSFNRPYPGTYYQGKSKTEIAQVESHRINQEQEAESLTEFTDRLESELNGMGIKVERDEIIKEEEAPDWF